MNRILKNVLLGVFLFQSYTAIALPEGWKQIVKDPITDQNVPVDTYIFSKGDDNSKFLTLRIVVQDYSEKNLLSLASELAKENGCELEKSLKFEKEMSVISCSNEERNADYKFYIKGNHGQALLIGTLGLTNEEVFNFMDSMSAEYSKAKEGVSHE